MTAPAVTAPPVTETEAVAYGWKVVRAAQAARWPEPTRQRREIYRALARLSTELEMYGRLADDAWAREAAPLTRARHAEDALKRAADLTVLLKKYCPAQAVQPEGVS